MKKQERIDSNCKQENKQEEKKPMFRVVHGYYMDFNSDKACGKEEYVETAEDYIIEDDDPLSELFEEEACRKAEALARVCGVSEVRIRKRVRERERAKARREAEKEALGAQGADEKKSSKSSETKAAASGCMQEIENRRIKCRMKLLESNGADNAKVEADLKKAVELKKLITKRRMNPQIEATLREADSYLTIETKELDKDPFLLNTPQGTICLKTGAMQPHNPYDYCTKMTNVSPSTDGHMMWEQFITLVTCGDQGLARCLQEIAGMCLVGKVNRESLILAYGTGGNGKTTFFRVLSWVMGITLGPWIQVSYWIRVTMMIVLHWHRFRVSA